MLAAGLGVLLPIRAQEFGQRNCIVAGPDGVPVDVITPIEPGEQLAAQFG